MEQPTHEPFGTYWNDDPIAIRTEVALAWDQLAIKLAGSCSRVQAHFLNEFVAALDRLCCGVGRTQMQSLCVAQDGLVLERRTVEVLEDIVHFFKERGKPA